MEGHGLRRVEGAARRDTQTRYGARGRVVGREIVKLLPILDIREPIQPVEPDKTVSASASKRERRTYRGGWSTRGTTTQFQRAALPLPNHHIRGWTLDTETYGLPSQALSSGTVMQSRLPVS